MKGSLVGMLKGVVAVAALTASVAGNASSVTYDFTGTTTYSTGIYSGSAVGTAVTGTYTINFGAYDPSISHVPVVTNGNWSYANQGGSALGLPLQTALVFSTTLYGAGGVSYQSSISGLFQDTSVVTGGTLSTIPYSLTMLELALPVLGSNDGTGSALVLQGTTPVWNSSGLPVLAAANVAAGQVATYQVGNGYGLILDQLDYKVDSLKAVTSAPEIDPTSMVSGLTILLGALAVIRGRRAIS